MIFVHGHTFIQKDGNYYTGGLLNNALFAKYKN